MMCGRELVANAAFCMNCGAPVARMATGMPPWGAYPQRPVQHVDGVWYLVPLFFGWIGGIVAWAVNRDKDPGRARNLLIFGIIVSIVNLVFLVVLFLALAPVISPTP